MLWSFTVTRFTQLAVALACFTSSLLCHAQTLAPIRPIDPEISLPDSPLLLEPALPRLSPSKPSGSSRELSDEDLKNDPQLASMILNQAMLSEDWEVLRRIMRFYPMLAGADPILRDYIQGALYRHDGDYPQAIALYEKIIQAHPDLDYVRLELAIMLFENKQYSQAQIQFAQARQGHIEAAAHLNAQRYQAALAEQKRWKLSLLSGLSYNDNLNSANQDKFLYLPLALSDGNTYWLPFAKSPEQFPKASWGWRYRAAATLERHIKGQHFLTLQADVDGTAYFTQRQYDERSLNLAIGYKYQNINSWLALTPQLSKTWMGERAYSHSHGMGAEAGYMQGKWQWMSSYLWLKRQYDDKPYQGYDGHVQAVSATAVHIWNPSVVSFASLGWQRESVQSGEYSSRMPWVQTGAILNWKNNLAARLSIRYGEKRYDEPYKLFLRTPRRDKEWRFSTQLWKPNWKPWGLEPKLDYHYTHNKSNLPIYSRNRNEFTLLFEKRF